MRSQPSSFEVVVAVAFVVVDDVVVVAFFALDVNVVVTSNVDLILLLMEVESKCQTLVEVG